MKGPKMKTKDIKRNYKLIASDLDGTLLSSSAELSKENSDAIDGIAKKGVIFAPTTGRALYEIPASVRNHKSVRYLITSNGAVITDLRSGLTNKALIDRDTFFRAYNIMKEYSVFFTVHHEGMSYVDELLVSDPIMESYRMTEYYKNHIRKTNAKIPYFDDYFSSGISPEMICGFFRYDREMKECIERLNALGFLHVTGSESGSIEVISQFASKGNALVSLANRLDISIEDSIGIGDSPNDTTLIEAAGLGLATSNAAASLKSIADEVICSNNEHVAKFVLEKLL